MNLIYHFQIASRSLRHKMRSTILLVISMTVGLVMFMLVSAYVTYEHAYDQVFPDANNIYRITTDIYSQGELKLSKPACERAIGRLLTEKFPEVIETGFLVGASNPQYKIGENIFNNEQVYHASSGFLDLFSIRLIQGNVDEVLQKPYTVFISKTTAKKYFGNEDPVGKSILKYPGYDYRVEGVYEDIPKQAHFNADMFLSFHENMHLPPPVLSSWGETVYYTYLKVHPETKIVDLEKRINVMISSSREENLEKNNLSHQYHLQPLTDIHLHSNLKNELQKNAKPNYLYILLIVSLLILFAVSFNYIHFSFTKILNDASGIGLRKVVGADRIMLVQQSLLESLLIHFVSVVLAFGIGMLLIPFFQNQFGMTIDFSFNNDLFWIIFLSILLINIAINGVVPGYLISRYNSLELFQLKSKPIVSGISFRQLFVAGQFAIIIAILVGIFGISKQVHFLKGKDKGLNIVNTLAIKTPQNLRRTSSRLHNLDAFEQEIMRNPYITEISQSNRIPGEILAFNFNFSEKGTDQKGKAAVLVTGMNYLELFQIQLLAGENPGNGQNRNTCCLINNSCLADLGYNNPEDAIGKLLNLKDESDFQNLELKIKGVCSDFNFQNMSEKPGPMILCDWTENMVWGNYLVKLRGDNLSSVIPFLEEKFKTTFPNFPFEYIVLEDFFNQQFDQEVQLISMLQTFVLIAILISAINLFAMAMSISLSRTKEIGIRKVNGAKISEILTMLNKDFVKWVAIAFVIATPIAWYAMHKWLENFAYKTTLSWWIFALAGLLALGIALLTVSWQSWKAATRNPVEALRYE